MEHSCVPLWNAEAFNNGTLQRSIMEHNTVLFMECSVTFHLEC